MSCHSVTFFVLQKFTRQIDLWVNASSPHLPHPPRQRILHAAVAPGQRLPKVPGLGWRCPKQRQRAPERYRINRPQYRYRRAPLAFFYDRHPLKESMPQNRMRHIRLGFVDLDEPNLPLDIVADSQASPPSPATDFSLTSSTVLD